MDHTRTRQHLLKLSELAARAEKQLRRGDMRQREIAAEIDAALATVRMDAAAARGSQTSLFGGDDTPPEGIPYTPYTQHETSIAAAKKARGFAGRQRLAVLRAIAQRPDTDDGVCARLNAAGMRITGDSVRPRRGELLDRKLIEYTGRKEPTRSGNPANVYAITDAGRTRLATEDRR